ncbi:alpha/beta hydrolase [Glaciihabitans sp. dw_435]|uniref:alpha/beta hydrolase n=1 Tax=Glaciihabitans sp. dw_435 TaxID=2720081 RepID=UPI001BD5FFA9|nr:alpha/beta hydrolase [Glaciihabitans sp. dw_435]
MPLTDPRLSDPDAAAIMAAITIANAGSVAPPRHLGTIEDARAASPVPAVNAAAFAVVSRDFVVPGSDGLTVRLYLPTNSEPVGTFVYLHGGGWALGGLDINDGVCRELTQSAGVAIVSVDYRLAPEHPFPAALDDGAFVLDWVAAGAPGIAETLPSALGVAGLSAGGALAAVLARRSRDGLAPRVIQQLLICPVLDCDFDRASYVDNANGLLLTADDMRWFWSMYAPDNLRGQVDVTPAALTDYADLPAATVIVAGADPLRDEALDYAGRMTTAGVSTETLLVDGVMHAFPAFPGIASGLRVLREASERVTDLFSKDLSAQAQDPLR